MPTHAEKRVMPYTAQQLYDLVANIEKYPEFLPWVVSCIIVRRLDNVLYADLSIGFKMFREKFTSRVTLTPPERIDVAYLEGPFKYLNNHWYFTQHDDGKTEIDFYVDFEFRSRLFQTVIGALFNEAVSVMVAAFERRAKQLYGTPDVA